MKIRFPFFRRNERQKLSWLSNIGYLKQGGFPKKENFRDSLFFFSRSTNFRFHAIALHIAARVARLFRIKLAVLRKRIENRRADYLYPDPFFPSFRWELRSLVNPD